MKLKNEMTLKILSKSVNESFARVAVASFIAQLDPTIEEINEIKTAVSEAVTNCIVHGYKDVVGNIYITAKIFSDNRVRIVIKDKGCGIEDIEKAMEPLYTTVTTGERSGMGFTIMQTFMDKVKVISTKNKGTRVMFEKVLQSKQSSGRK